MANGATRYGPYKGRLTESFLADLDHFLSSNRHWGEISLLKAVGMDHRFFARLRDGNSYRIDLLDAVAEAMNRATGGELQPDAFRNIRKPKADESAGTEE